MAIIGTHNNHLEESTCGYLLQKLQQIWNEVGESDEVRNNMLLQLDRECLDVYKRKVDQASNSRALLLSALANSKENLSILLSSLGQNTLYSTSEKSSGTIKEQLADIEPKLEKLLEQKKERIKEFSDVQSQIQNICNEISENVEARDQVKMTKVNESHLTLEKLEEFRSQLQELQKEKNDRLHKVLDFVSTVHDICAVLGMDFCSTIIEVHPSLDDSVGVQSKSIRNDTLSKLARIVMDLKEDKKLRLQKLQKLAVQLSDLWNLMDTPMEERSLFDYVSCNISSTVDEVTIPGALALDLIEQAEAEVERLDNLKASKMKEIALKKQAELENIYARAHIEINTMAANDRIMTLIDSGDIEPTELLVDLDDQILRAKEEALSRKEILDRVEKWMSTCDEESWLEDYNRDDNRYSSSRGAHLNLKRAEKARVLVNKIPAMVDTLIAKTRTWEENHDLSFTYDGVPLLAMLDEYAMLRHDREEEKRRMRDQKKFGEQQVMSMDHETIFGSRVSPNLSHGPKKVGNSRTNGAPTRRLSGSITKSAAGKDGKKEGAYLAVSKDVSSVSP